MAGRVRSALRAVRARGTKRPAGTGVVVAVGAVGASVEQTWAAVTDWARQGEWMLATAVRPVSQQGAGVGARLEATTRLGPVRVVDTMAIAVWEPPHRCVVAHTGRVVRGTGTFLVEPRDPGARFVWREDLDLPLGRAGALGWPLVRPLVAAGMRLSVRRFAAQVSA